MLTILFISMITMCIGMGIFIYHTGETFKIIEKSLKEISADISVCEENIMLFQVRFENENYRWESHYKDSKEQIDLNLKNYEFLVNHCNQTSEKIDKIEVEFSNVLEKLNNVVNLQNKDINDVKEKIQVMNLGLETDFINNTTFVENISHIVHGLEDDFVDIEDEIEKLQKRIKKLETKVVKKKEVKSSKEAVAPKA